MYQMMLRRKNGKKGFTLVEVIVVLVILAILAAIMIPAMTGWIEKAQNRGAIVEARTLVLAAQTVASEAFGTNGEYSDAEAVKLADLGGEAAITAVEEDGKITSASITTSKGIGVTYTAGADEPYKVGGGSGESQGEVTNP